MKLNEVASSDQIELLVSMVNKLIARGVKVEMHSVTAGGKPLIGIIKGITPVRYSARYSLAFNEIKENGALDLLLDVTEVTMWELENSQLKKQPDGSYILNLPNEEAQ